MIAFIKTLLGLLPGFAWLLFYLEEEEGPHREPKRIVASVFMVGMAFAFFALVLQVLLNPALANFGIPPLSPLSLLFLALIEEFVKFLAAYLCVHKNPEFDQPVDAMIYMVVAALGFATIENLGALHSGQSQSLLLGGAFETATLRFVGATLLHSLTSALVGYYWAISIREFHTNRFIVYGIVLATVLHAIFNYLILNYGNVVYPVVLVTIIGFFVLSDFEKLKRRTL